MTARSGLLLIGSALFVSVAALRETVGAEATLPDKDLRARPPRTLNTPRVFPPVATKADWQARARDIRENVLWSCGLWPMPPKTPLNAKIFGRIERDGYSVEKVAIETYPGFHLGGNLYRPVGKGRGPFPGVLNPHGHWSNGRLVDGKDGSVAARCIQFARMGMVAFCYDMVGYNDTQFAASDQPGGYNKHRSFATDPTNLLWNISLMGLQTWDSIRALDFLESLPDVDKTRLACTGASGGGTQTFMLGSIDDRLALLAPTVMVSHSMQGGCSCENAPGLRVDYSNMELAAVPAPRPQIMVGATGDWTKATMTVEGPAIERIYQLFGAPEKLRYRVFDFGHNYNQTTRETVYGWFNRWLLNAPSADPVKELPYTKEPDKDLLVYPDKKLPPGSVTASQLIDFMLGQIRNEWARLSPRDQTSLGRFRSVMLPAWRHCLQLEFPVHSVVSVKESPNQAGAGPKAQRFAIGRPGAGDRLPVLMFGPQGKAREAVVVFVHPDGKKGYCDASGAPTGIAARLLEAGFPVVMADTFLTGELANPTASAARKQLENFFCTYNRTDLQERVQDLVTLCAWVRQQAPGRRVVLCGTGRAGLWTLLAAPAADAVVADADSFNPADDATLLSADLFAPGLRRLGGFETALALAAPHPAFVYHTGDDFKSALAKSAFSAGGAEDQLVVAKAMASADDIADWVAKQR